MPLAISGLVRIQDMADYGDAQTWAGLHTFDAGLTVSQNSATALLVEKTDHTVVMQVNTNNASVGIGKAATVYGLDVATRYIRADGAYPIILDGTGSHIIGCTGQQVGFGADGHYSVQTGPGSVYTFITTKAPDFSTGIGAYNITPTGTLNVYDATAVTGATRMWARSGVAQGSGELFGLYANDGTTPLCTVSGLGVMALQSAVATSAIMSISPTITAGNGITGVAIEPTLVQSAGSGYGWHSIPKFAPTANITSANGMYQQTKLQLSTKNCSALRNVWLSYRTEASYSGILTNAYTIMIDSPSIAGSTPANNYGLYILNQSAGSALNYAIYTNAGQVSFGDVLFLRTIKSGATQVAAGAAANEVWKTSGHASLPDNVLMIGV